MAHPWFRRRSCVEVCVDGVGEPATLAETVESVNWEDTVLVRLYREVVR